MPEAETYAIIGGIMIGCFVIGGAMGANVYSPPEIKAAGGFFVFGGVIMLLVLLGIGVYDGQKRWRSWSIERKSDYLDRRWDELEVKERELEVKDRERKYKKKAQKFAERSREKENDSYKKANYSTESPPTRTYPKGFIPTEQEEKSASAPIQTPKQNLKSDSKEEPILETNKPVPDFLKQQSNVLESHNELDKAIEVDQTYTDEDYKSAISMGEHHLQCLWALYQEPNHRFLKKQDLIVAAQGHGGNRTPYYNAINELKEKELIVIYEKPYGDQVRTTGMIELTQKGLDLIEKARKEKVTSWNQFLEKYFTQS